MASLFYPLDCL